MWGGEGSKMGRKDGGDNGKGKEGAGEGEGKEGEPVEEGEGQKEDDEQWAYATLKVLRASMMSAKLVPPGEVFVVESEQVGGVGEGKTSGKRVVLKHVRDVERRFREVRFGRGMLTDHSPGRYEAALEGLRAGVMGSGAA